MGAHRRGGRASLRAVAGFACNQGFVFSLFYMGANRAFVLTMAGGSVAGTLLGGLLLGVVPAAILIPLLVALLLLSANKIWRHQTPEAGATSDRAKSGERRNT